MAPRIKNQRQDHWRMLSHAQMYTAELDPFQEIPPHNTPGYGEANFTLSGTTLSVDAGTGQYGSLLGGALSVVIGDAAPGANGPTVISLTLDTPGQTTGTFSGSGTLTAGQITDLNAGNLYVNIRDSVYPSGEIRGQILAVPEPATITLASLGALALLAIRRKI
ncbi:MAG: CHRD domain-containing protein [Limisphaerales bacterium]